MRPAYAGRGFRPIWIRGKRADHSAEELVHMLEASGNDGLSPKAYDPEALSKRLAALPDSPSAGRMRTELLLTSAFTRYVHDLHTPSPGADLIYTDRALQPQFRNRGQLVRMLAEAESPGEALKRSSQTNILYSNMRDVLVRFRAGERAQ